MLKITHAQPTQKSNILFRNINWLRYKYKHKGLSMTVNELAAITGMITIFGIVEAKHTEHLWLIFPVI